jgi:hypothetical protein
MPHHRLVPTELGSGVTVAVPLVGELKSQVKIVCEFVGVGNRASPTTDVAAISSA